MLEIDELNVNSSKSVREFVCASWEISNDVENWVPPIVNDEIELLSIAKNPFLKGALLRLFLVRMKGRAVGRIAYIEGDSILNVEEVDNTAFFGYFMCINDVEVAKLLINKLTLIAIERGKIKIIGPFCPTLYDSPGVLTSGFDVEPSFMTAYNPPYYNSIIQSNGFYQFKSLCSYEAECTEEVPKKLLKSEMISEKNGVIVKRINMKHYTSESRELFSVLGMSLRGNWGEVRFSDKQIDFIVKKLKNLASSKYILYAEYNKKIVGVICAAPSCSKLFKKINGKINLFNFLTAIRELRNDKSVRIAMLGVLPEYRRLGIEGALMSKLWRNCYKSGITKGDFSWILTENKAMQNIAIKLNASKNREWWIYRKDL